MKKLVLVLFLVGNLFGGNISENIKKGCQYLIYGNGEDDSLARVYMFGVIDATSYALDKDKMTKHSKSNSIDISKLACKEALNENSSESFKNKFYWGVTVTLNKDYVRFSNLK